MQRWTASALDGARVGIIGLGLEGRAALAWLGRRASGAEIELFDEQVIAPQAAAAAAACHVGPLERLPLHRCDVLLRSPGVRARRPALDAARGRGVPITTASSLFLCDPARPPVVAVTGTKGKSTVSALAAALLGAAGLRTGLGGNIGVPLLDLDTTDLALVVAELSSYQTTDLVGAPEAALLTNLHPEHLDWHGGERAYYRDKLRLLELATGPALVSARNATAVAWSRRIAGRRLFGTTAGWVVDETGIRRAGRRLRSGPAWRLRGRHNLDNLEAALAIVDHVVRARGGDLDAALAAIDRFTGLAHRQEIVAEARGLRCVDDSIATTPHATLAALAAFADQPVAVIVGGYDRGLSWEAFARRLGERPVAGVVVRGANAPHILAALAAHAPGQAVREAGSLDEAVALARTLLPAAGGTVLLSPGAPSFGEFRDFRARGQAFRALCR